MKQVFNSVLLALGLMLACTDAEARRRGVIGVDCGGCHGYDDDLTLGMNPLVATPGATVTAKFTIHDSGAKEGGIYIDLEDPEQFSLGSGSGLAEVVGGLTHTTPGTFSAGVLTYEVSWKVPSEPGATRFSVGGVAANGNGNNGGDKGNSKDFDVVYGCEPQTFYRDFDGDGYGTSDLPRVFCEGAPPSGYATEGGDCYEGSAERHPFAVELCNQRDDDCDGEIDEEAIPVQLFPDADGDGFYSGEEGLSSDSILGCVPTRGYAAEGGDCDADNPNAHPDGVEVCDLFTDEDCNGRVDDRVSPLCGVGWCVRESFSCDAADCTPGQPASEICNFIDDDCDGDVDEGVLCEEGFVCAAGRCRDADEVQAAVMPRDDAEGVKAMPSEPSVEEGKGPMDLSSTREGCGHVPGHRRGPLGLQFLLLLALACCLRVWRNAARHH